MGVVGGDERLDLLRGGGGVGKARAPQALAAQDREPDLDEREPGGVDRQEGEDERPLGAGGAAPGHPGGGGGTRPGPGPGGGGGRGGAAGSSRSSSAQTSRERCWRRPTPSTRPSATRKPANRSTVPRRTYSNSRRAGRPGAAGWSGAVGVRTPMPGLSSTQNSGPSVGGLGSSSMAAAALPPNTGS